jgi:putative transposase
MSLNIGGDIHVMLALRRSSREVVVADEHFDGPDMIGELLGERQCLAHYAGDALTQCVVEPLDVIGFGGVVNSLSDLSSSHLVCDTRHMNTLSTRRYKHHRFPVEIISHSVWLYFRFCLSYRDVEELLFARGITVTYEAIRQWCRKFGQLYANQLHRRRPRPGAKWHLDEVFLTIRGEHHYLWRAVDQDGNVLDILVQRRRNKAAAKKFFRKLLKGLRYIPRVMITDQLKSYGAARRELLPGVEHRQHRYLNNRAENSHQPTRQRERRMQGFKSPGQAQRFLSAYGPIAQHFRPRRHLLPAAIYREEMRQRFQSWKDVTSLAAVA